MKLMYSIIIPVKEINDYVLETVPYIRAMECPDWELIILPNEVEDSIWDDDRIKIVPSGSVGPARKRDLGAKMANGNVLVFLDDDSYPSKELLTVASSYFEKKDVVAIGGPGITPPLDNFWQRVSGAVFLSKLSGGNPERYVPVGKARPVDDWPSVNLMVRKPAFWLAGGFDSDFWPGEDTKFCLKLIQATGERILYVPELIVWHHRRAGFFRHLKQVGNYGLHRGFFVKKYPETSRKFIYFVPAAFFLFAVITVALPIFPAAVKLIFATGWACYFFAILSALIQIKKFEKWSVAIASIPYIISTHFYYGFNFIRGLFKSELVSKLR